MNIIWDVNSISDAKKIILTGDTEKRWEETHWEVSRIVHYMPFAANVLDYGCGIGRIAKELIDLEPHVFVTGVDSSENMQKLAMEYVNSFRFEVESVIPMSRNFDFAIFSLVLQHMPIDDVAEVLFEVSMNETKFVYIHNLHKRRLWDPAREEYYDDTKQEKLMGLIDTYFRLIHSLPAEDCHFAGVYKVR